MPLRYFVAVIALMLPIVAGPATAARIDRVTSPGGIEAWLIQDPSVPIISMSFAFRGGAALDPQGKAGLSEMVSGLLDEGAGELDSQAFQSALEEIAASIGFDAGRDQFEGSLRTLTENKDRAFELLRLALIEPRFDAEPITRIRGQLLANLRAEAESPRRISGERWMEAVFPEHPYGRPVSGTAESLQAIKMEDLAQFAQTRLTRDRVVIGVVGDISPEDLAPVLDKVFGALPATSELAQVPDADPAAEGRVIVVEKSIPQSVVVFGQKGVLRNDPDYYALYVANHILGGGGFSSRLTEEVREKRGLAYSVYSYLSPMEHAGLIMGGFGTQNGRVAEALDLVRKEWRRMAQEGVTEAELQNAKNYLNGSFPLRLDSGRRIASLLLAIQIHDLGIDYIDRRPSLINAVTTEDIRRVAQLYLRPDALTVVVVGQPVGIPGTN